MNFRSQHAIDMMLFMIKCGNCGNNHRNADEVRECYGPPPTSCPPPRTTCPPPRTGAPHPSGKLHNCGNSEHSHSSKESAKECLRRGGRPNNVNETVYVTDRGDRFHNKQDCSALNIGLIHTLRAVLWLKIKNDHYTACKKCVY